jgi:F0F1-type ATP synthase membrane subunit b/b'
MFKKEKEIMNFLSSVIFVTLALFVGLYYVMKKLFDELYKRIEKGRKR